MCMYNSAILLYLKISVEFTPNSSRYEKRNGKRKKINMHYVLTMINVLCCYSIFPICMLLYIDTLKSTPFSPQVIIVIVSNAK